MYSDIRREDVILTRLRIGHSRLTHKHYLLGEDFLECIPCDCRLTIKHVLIECIDTADIRKQYFNCTDLKTLFNCCLRHYFSIFIRNKFNPQNLNFSLLTCMCVMFIYFKYGGQSNEM